MTMARKEPSSAALYAARLAKAYPALSAYSAASLAHELCSIERAQRRHAERACSGADGGYVRRRHASIERDGMDRVGMLLIEHDPVAEERAGKRVAGRVRAWQGNLRNLVVDTIGASIPKEHGVEITLEHDPRGSVLLVRLPGEADAS